MKIRTTLALCILALCLSWLSFSPSNLAGIAVDLNRFVTGATAAASSVPPGARVCGTVSAYAPATSNAAGSITIAGLTYAIAPGSSLKGVLVGKDLCFTFCFDANGRIVRQDGDTYSGQNVALICGIVSNFSSALGSMNGSVTIGGAKVRISPGSYLGGQDQIAPGSSSCLVTNLIGDVAGPGSFFIQDSSPKQIHLPTIVRGRTFGSNSQEDTFYLPDPTILSLSSDQASVFPINQYTFGKQFGVGTPKTEGFSYSTPNSTVQAVSCNDSFWDIVFEIASSGITEGDMVTVNLLNSDKTVAQQLAMFTVQEGAAQLTNLHPDVKITANGMNVRTGYQAQFLIPAGNSGLRTFPLALILSQTSKAFMGCYQLSVEIKRSSNIGTISIAFGDLVVKRMERPNDRDVSINIGLLTNLLGWFPTGKTCDFFCSACATIPVTPQSSAISGFVYCDGNNNGVKDSSEGGLANVEIKLLSASGQLINTVKTSGDGSYRFTVLPGTYTVAEVQPTVGGIVGDGKDSAGSCSGTVGDDVISNITVGANTECINYNFGEMCGKCDTICWRTTQFFITNIRYLPGGTVLISGVNANNPVGIQQSSNAIRTALQGGSSGMQRLNKEFVTAQLSLAYSGGGGSPVVFNTFWSSLTCSGVAFAPVTLSNGVTLSPNSLLDTLMTQTTLAIKENRFGDMGALADIWTQVNGRCGQ